VPAHSLVCLQDRLIGAPKVNRKADERVFAWPGVIHFAGAKAGRVFGGDVVEARKQEDSQAGRVTARSVALGAVAAMLIGAITPFNNVVAGNTFLVGNLMPVAALLVLVVAVVFVNVPLRALAPRWVLSRMELTVVFSMALVGCAMPSAGLMRYLPGHLVSPFWHAQQSPATDNLLNSALPADWVFPSMRPGRASERGGDPVVGEFVGRAPGAGVAIDRVPWQAWVKPAVAWGTFVLLLYGAVLCLLAIVHHQWARNERLRFPITEVYASLLEEPSRGHWLPQTLRSPGFWIVWSMVLLLHGLNLLSSYDDRWPAVPLGYNFNSMFTTLPGSALTYGVKAAKVMFTVIGICYFIPSKVAGSLLFFLALYNAVNMVCASSGAEFSLPMQRDQTTGSILVIAGLILYTGRRHWMRTLAAMIGRPGSDEESTHLAPLAGWGLVACAAGLSAWLTLAGSPPLNAVLIVLSVFTLFLVTARIVGETGLIYVQLHTAIYRPWIYAADGLGWQTTPKGYYLLNKIYSVFTHDLRENGMVYSQHAMVCADAAGARRNRWGFPLALLLAIGVGFVSSGASMLFCEYNFDVTLDRTARSPINGMAVVDIPRDNVLEPTRQFTAGNAPLFGEQHTRWLHLLIGGATTAVVAAGHMTFSWFPLHPIGAVMCYSYALQNTWFSLLIGWLAKLLVLRLGGVSLYNQVRPLFIGMVLGECTAIVLSAGANMILLAMGVEYVPSSILP
jgi:hypothetical protein